MSSRKKRADDRAKGKAQASSDSAQRAALKYGFGSGEMVKVAALPLGHGALQERERVKR